MPRGTRPPAAHKAALSAALKALSGGRVRSEIAAMTLTAQERSLALRIATGSVKRHLTLDNIFNAVCRKKHVPEPVREIFRQAVYQMLFTNVPIAAAASIAVDLARRISPHYGRLTNSLLRAVDALPREFHAQPPVSDVFRRSVFLSTDEGGPGSLLFDRRLVRRDPKGDLEHASSLPAFFAWRYLKRLGDESFWRFVDWADSAPLLTVRPNRLRLTPEATLSSLLPPGAATLEMDGLSTRLYSIPGPVLAILPGLEDGSLIAQDAANVLPVEAAAVQPDMSVLDLCAAPGGKTQLLAESMCPGARLVALELVPERAALLRSNLDNWGVPGVEVITADAADLPREFVSAFDVVLADVPCSNTGQHARRPEVRLRVTRDEIRRLALQQRSILSSALSAVRPGGRVIYSTCSLEPEENDDLVRSVDGVDILSEKITWPLLHRHDGGYFAVLARR